MAVESVLRNNRGREMLVGVLPKLIQIPALAYDFPESGILKTPDDDRYLLTFEAEECLQAPSKLKQIFRNLGLEGQGISLLFRFSDITEENPFGYSMDLRPGVNESFFEEETLFDDGLKRFKQDPRFRKRDDSMDVISRGHIVQHVPDHFHVSTGYVQERSSERMEKGASYILAVYSTWEKMDKTKGLRTAMYSADESLGNIVYDLVHLSLKTIEARISAATLQG